MAETYRIVRSGRRTLALEITREGEVLVRAPYRIPLSVIEDFVSRHGQWICVHRQRVLDRQAVHGEPTKEEEARLRELAKAILPERVAHFSRVMGVSPAAVTVTGARTRFGSCSGKGRIAFSFRLMAYPPEAVDYVVVHELAHLVHHDHSKNFYALVASILPDWKERAAILKK